MKITQTSTKQRIVHSSVFAWMSSIFIWASQYIVGQKVDQILSSSWVDLIQTLVTSFINQSAYNLLKARLHKHIEISEDKIIGISILLVSILWVWAPKYLVHLIANTKWPEAIASIYMIANIVAMILYEKAILQKKAA